MRLNKLVISVAALAVVSSGLFAGTSNMDVEKMFEKECQGCHGPNHEGGVGSDLRPGKIEKKNAYMLSEVILNGRAGTAMPGFADKMKKDDADKMVDYLQSFKGKKIEQLTMDAVKAGWKTLNNRAEFEAKYATPVDVAKNTDIVFVTERDAARVVFLDGTNGKVLSKHPACFAVHVT
ncbi:MAG: c-type cytochrome, partial [Sulfurimonas sp.]|nr:c-type cytochrome [Sulfurimonas sp.]